MLKVERAFFLKLSEAGFFPVDLRVKSINMDSPADKAGIKAGDVVIAIDNKPIKSFMELKTTLNKSKSADAIVSVWSAGSKSDKKITPDVQM